MKTWTQRLHIPDRAAGLAAFFTLALFAYEQYTLPFQVHDFREIFSPLSGVLLSVLTMLLACGFFWAAFRGGLVVRLVCLSIFVLDVLTEYGYVYALGRFSIIQDYEIGLTAVNAQLIGNALLAYIQANLVSIVPILSFGALLLATRKAVGRKPDASASSWWRWIGFAGLRRLGAVLGLMLLVFSLLYPYCRGTFTTVSVSAGLRTLTFTGWQLLTRYHGPRQEVPYRAAQTPSNNIVLVVDESVRCDHLSLNGYQRKTTLYLQDLQRQGLLTNWGDAVSTATMSLNSNVFLLTGVTDLPDIRENTRHMPTIFHYARAAGYKTYHLDAQMDTLWLTTQRDQSVIDHWVKASELAAGAAEYEVDFEAAQRVREVIHASTGNFIWLNKSGMHFPYPQRYPPAATVWQPALQDAAYDYSQYAQIKNAYDNAILYNLDHFFQEIIGPDGLPENTTIIYTSDHGQTLSEHGESWPHSGNTPMEACVPLFMIQDQPLNVDTNFHASHANIFPTVLDLMNIPFEGRIYPYALSLLSARASDNGSRWYIFGTYDSRLSSAVYLYPPSN